MQPDVVVDGVIDAIDRPEIPENFVVPLGTPVPITSLSAAASVDSAAGDCVDHHEEAENPSQGNSSIKLAICNWRAHLSSMASIVCCIWLLMSSLLFFEAALSDGNAGRSTRDERRRGMMMALAFVSITLCILCSTCVYSDRKSFNDLRSQCVIVRDHTGRDRCAVGEQRRQTQRETIDALNPYFSATQLAAASSRWV